MFKGGIIKKQVKICEFDFIETELISNKKRAYQFYQNTRNRFNTNHEISEWVYIGENQKILFNESKSNLELISLNYSSNHYIWSKKPLHKNKKECIVINMDNNIVENNSLKFGLINRNVTSDKDNYEKYKILQFANVNDSFSLDYYDINAIKKDNEKNTLNIKTRNKTNLKYKFQKTNNFKLTNNNGIEIHYKHDNKWNSIELPLLLNEDAYFFFKIRGLNNKIILNDIFQETCSN